MKKIMYVLAVITAVFSLNLPAAPVTLTITTSGDKFLLKWLDGVVKDYEKQNPGTKVKVDTVTFVGTDYHTKLAISLPTDTTQDVVWLNCSQYKSFLRGKLIAPIPDLKNWPDIKNYYSNLIDPFVDNGEYYAVPVNAVVIGFFYNKDIFKQAGLPIPWQPKTWQDVYDAVKTIKAKCPKTWPIQFGIAPNEYTTFQTILTLLYGTDTGSKSILRDGKWIVTSQELLDTYTYIYRMIKEGLTPPKALLYSSEIVNDSSSIEKKYYPKGNIAIDLGGCWIYRYWTGPLSKVKDFTGFIPMPTKNGQPPEYISIGGAWLFCVPTGSKHKKEAADFIKFACNYKNALEYSKIMFDLSPRKDVGEDKDFPADMKIFLPYVKYSIMHPLAEQYPVIATEMAVPLEGFVNSDQTPLEAMNRFANSVELTLGKDGVVREYKEEKK